jgi:adenosylcobyric acid synthase
MEKYPLYYHSDSVAGTHVHGVFDDDGFRNAYFKNINSRYQGYCYSHHRETEIQGFADLVRNNLDIDKILETL